MSYLVVVLGGPVLEVRSVSGSGEAGVEDINECKTIIGVIACEIWMLLRVW